jgi:hypothetical protein
MRPVEIPARFDGVLATEGLQLEAVVVGGAALALLGITARETRDCDIVEPSLPEAILASARRFSGTVRSEGVVLRDDWLSNGPSSLASVLPNGWRTRVQPAFRGAALVLHALSRDDLLKSKLFALCDRALDLPDCMALAPTESELALALPWLEEQDLNPEWPAHVRATLSDLAGRLGHGL